MKKKNVLKIAWVLITCTAVFASCLRSNAVNVHAADEESDTEKWLEYTALLADVLVDISSKPTTAQSVALGIQYMIAVTESINTANDATLYNNCASIMYCYDFKDSAGKTTYHVNNLVGSPYKRYESSDGIVTHTFDTYPNGTSVQGIFSASDSTITVQNNGGSFSIVGNPQYQQYWTAPFNKTGATWPFDIVTSGTVTKLEESLAGSSVLGLSLGAVLGGSIATQSSEPSTTIHLPKATAGQTTNDYIAVIYQTYEEKFGVPFEYTFPESLPSGLILPDGSVSGGEEDATGDININVEVEFPTHLVPDVPEPDTYDYSQIQQVEIPLANEGLIKSTWISGFSTLIDSMVYTMDAFHLREVVLLLCVVGIFVYLIVRW